MTTVSDVEGGKAPNLLESGARVARNAVLSALRYSPTAQAVLKPVRIPGHRRGRSSGTDLTEWVPQPFDFQTLSDLYLQSAWNKASVDAIVDSVVGYQLEIEAVEVGGQDNAQRELVKRWLEELGGDHPIENLLKAAQTDYENTGNMYFELARDADGKPARLFHVPSATVWVRRDRERYKQRVGTREAMFRRYRSPTNDLREIIHIWRPNPVSDYYGIPDHLAALGAIIMDMHARDYNLDQFETAFTSLWALVVAGELPEEERVRIENKFKTLGRTRKSWLEPLVIRAVGADNPNVVQFHRLSSEIKEASWRELRRLCRDEILAVRRVPPSKVAQFETSRFQTLPEQAEIFRDEVVVPRQRALEFMFDRLLRELGVTDWRVVLPYTDSTQQQQVVDTAVRMVSTQSATRNEIRSVMGLPPLPADKGGDDLVGVPQGAGGGAGGMGGLLGMLGAAPGKSAPIEAQEELRKLARTIEG